MRSVKQQQSRLFNEMPTKNAGVLPSTRYQGSKDKILKWINYYTKDLSFETVLDAFGGTGCVGYMFKKHPKIKYPSFIQDTFHDIYFTDEENKWLDVVITNIGEIKDTFKQALAYYSLFQSCIIKRPYNLFHRKNLYIRTAEVERSFGNKKTWDTPFEDHFLKFVEEANNAVFDNGKKNQASHSDILNLTIPKIDLVYIDTPYISVKGVGVNYFDFYHFLEGIVSYYQWENLIDENSKHKRIKNGKNEGCNKS